MHAVSILRKALTMKIAVEDNKRSSIVVDCKGLKTVSKRKGIDETNSL